MNPSYNTEEKINPLGDIYADIMDFRDACLEARSELYYTQDVTATTNKVVRAQEAFEKALVALIEEKERAARKDEGQRFKKDVSRAALNADHPITLGNALVWKINKRKEELEKPTKDISKRGDEDE